MIYVLEVYDYKYNQKHQLVFSENSIKLNEFIDLTIEYQFQIGIFVVEHFVSFA